jgi:ABC-type phosphate transport system auxiliary subunit
VPETNLNFKTAIEINNDLVKLYTVLSEAELQTDKVSKIKEEFVTVIEDELERLRKSKIVL